MGSNSKNMINTVTTKKTGKNSGVLVVGYKQNTRVESAAHSNIKPILSPEEKLFLDLLADSFIKKILNKSKLL